MAKRRLNKRQAWRIEKIQQERVERAARQSHRAEQHLAGDGLAPEQPGLIIAHHGTQVMVEVLAGEERGKCSRAHLRANLEPLVTGDRVVWRPGADSGIGVVVALRERHTQLCRPDSGGVLRPVAANIDKVVVVVASEPQPHAQMLDRYLIAAENQGIEALILLNKADLLHRGNRAAIDALLAIYPGLGYGLLRCSTTSGDGIAELRRQLVGHTSIFTGQSGVGKSSLINALLPATNAPVGAISQATGKGRHTTTTARLFHFPDGGDLIDSPGIRDFGLWHLDRFEIARGYPEFRPFLGLCKFRDCRHQQDPGCALQDAVLTGAISRRRLDSYHHLVGALRPT